MSKEPAQPVLSAVKLIVPSPAPLRALRLKSPKSLALTVASVPVVRMPESPIRLSVPWRVAPLPRRIAPWWLPLDDSSQPPPMMYQLRAASVTLFADWNWPPLLP